jgi:hypothetical protein
MLQECGSIGHSIYPVFLSAPRRVDALFIRSPAHPVMSLAIQGPELPTGHRRTLYRRSSCPSIPRSVSTCSSIYAIDFSGQFSTVPKDCGDVEIYMSPLFRGLGGIGEEHGEMAELMPATSTGVFTPSAEATGCDDSLSDSLSNYQFDITGHDLLPETITPSKANLSTEQSSTSAHPMKSSTTRPLKIDRSRKRTGPSVTSQRSPRAETQNVVPTLKPISRAAAHVNLHEAYRRDRLLAERKVSTRPGGITPAMRPTGMPSYPHPHAETPDRNITQVNTTQRSPDTFASYRFIPLYSKSLSPHCFRPFSFL